MSRLSLDSQKPRIRMLREFNEICDQMLGEGKLDHARSDLTVWPCPISLVWRRRPIDRYLVHGTDLNLELVSTRLYQGPPFAT